MIDFSIDMNIGLQVVGKLGVPKIASSFDPYLKAYKKAGGVDYELLVVVCDLVRHKHLAPSHKINGDARDLIRKSKWAYCFDLS